jgi:hypothetical protein
MIMRPLLKREKRVADLFKKCAYSPSTWLVYGAKLWGIGVIFCLVNYLFYGSKTKD